MKMTDGDRAALSWQRVPGIVRAHHVMLIAGRKTGFWIHAVQHPTAIRPYEVVRPNGEALRRKFHLLIEAKAACIAAFDNDEEEDDDDA